MDEVILQLLLHFRQLDKVLVVVRTDELRQVFSTVKLLLEDTIHVSSKMTPKQVKSNLVGSRNCGSGGTSSGSCVRVVLDAGGIALLPHEGTIVSSEPPYKGKAIRSSSSTEGAATSGGPGNKVFVIHAEGDSFNGRALSALDSAHHVLLLPAVSGRPASGADAIYLSSLPRMAVPPVASIQGLIARVKVARKIAALQSGSGGGEIVNADSEQQASAVASQLLDLRNQLKALMTKPLGAVAVWDFSKGCLVDSMPTTVTQSVPINTSGHKLAVEEVASSSHSTKCESITSTASSDSPATIRQKMVILGMISDVSMGYTTEALQREGAEQGRILAASMWMDKMDGCRASAPWKGVVRFGTSADAISRRVCEVINDQKAFKLHCLSKCQSPLDKEAAAVVFNTPKTASRVVSPKVLCRLSDLSTCRVVGFQWRPNPLGDGASNELWGGRFGKACGHNEVAMHFARPFAPIEVLNTHLCSRGSPAPGNVGFDGCLEFLAEQCRWFGRSMHVWDDKHFHFISSVGSVTSYSKEALLYLPIKKLSYVIEVLRHLILHEGSDLSTRQNLACLGAYIHIYTMNKGFHIQGLPRSVHKRIGQFLLPKAPGAWM
jgi:hypothetical protein